MSHIWDPETEARYEQCRLDVLALCDVLEAIADALPEDLDRQVCIHAARALGPILTRAHAFEEEVMFPAIEVSAPFCANPADTIERLRLEHAGDMCFAEEVAEVLLSYGRGEPSQGPEATGYMLRGFFEGVRRHVAAERDLLGPVGVAVRCQNCWRAERARIAECPWLQAHPDGL